MLPVIVYHVHTKGLQLRLSKQSCTSDHEDYFTIASSAEPDETLRSMAFHLGLQCLSKYLFIGLT